MTEALDSLDCVSCDISSIQPDGPHYLRGTINGLTVSSGALTRANARRLLCQSEPHSDTE